MQVVKAAIGVVQPALLIHSHCIDGEVAPAEVVFKAHRWVGMNFKAPIARACFALGACKCILVLRTRVKKDLEILSNRFKARLKKILGPCSHHQVVPVDLLIGHKRIPHRTANTINGDAGVKTCKIGVGSVWGQESEQALAFVLQAAKALRTQNC